MLNNINLPPYRKIFTRLDLNSFCIQKKEGLTKIFVSIEMPIYEIKVSRPGKEELRIRKYLAIDEFNVMLQDKFCDWHEKVLEQLETWIGPNFDKDVPE
jgi:hypothetical protein